MYPNAAIDAYYPNYPNGILSSSPGLAGGTTANPGNDGANTAQPQRGCVRRWPACAPPCRRDTTPLGLLSASRRCGISGVHMVRMVPGSQGRCSFLAPTLGLRTDPLRGWDRPCVAGGFRVEFQGDDRSYFIPMGFCPQCPGLAGGTTAYPGNDWREHGPTPTGLCPPCRRDTTPLGLLSASRRCGISGVHMVRMVPGSQGRCSFLAPTLGLRTDPLRGWDRPCVAGGFRVEFQGDDRSYFIPMGFCPQCPGLAGGTTAYPGNDFAEGLWEMRPGP